MDCARINSQRVPIPPSELSEAKNRYFNQLLHHIGIDKQVLVSRVEMNDGVMVREVRSSESYLLHKGYIHLGTETRFITFSSGREDQLNLAKYYKF